MDNDIPLLTMNATDAKLVICCAPWQWDNYKNEGRHQPLEENGKRFEHPKLPANFEIPLID